MKILKSCWQYVTWK